MTCFGLIKYLCCGRHSYRKSKALWLGEKNNKQTNKEASFISCLMYTNHRSLPLTLMSHVLFSNKGLTISFLKKFWSSFGFLKFSWGTQTKLSSFICVLTHSIGYNDVYVIVLSKCWFLIHISSEYLASICNTHFQCWGNVLLKVMHTILRYSIKKKSN